MLLGAQPVMLKLTYTETNFELEHLAQSVEEWVALRVTLAMRVGQGIHMEPSTAAFLLPRNLPNLRLLEQEIHQAGQDSRITVCPCDADYLEVTLIGLWFRTDYEGAAGVFLTAIDSHLELLLSQAWETAQTSASVMQS